MQEHVETHGFANAMDTFYKQYQNAGGINVPERIRPNSMTPSMRTLSILTTVLIAVSACGTSRPELPPDSPPEMVSQLTSDTGDDVLKMVTTYDWDDGGAVAGGTLHLDRPGRYFDGWRRRVTGGTGRGCKRRVPHGQSRHADGCGFRLPRPIESRSGTTQSPADQKLRRLAGGPSSVIWSAGSRAPSTPFAYRCWTTHLRCGTWLCRSLVADPEAGRISRRSNTLCGRGVRGCRRAAPPDSDE